MVTPGRRRAIFHGEEAHARFVPRGHSNKLLQPIGTTLKFCHGTRFVILALSLNDLPLVRLVAYRAVAPIRGLAGLEVTAEQRQQLGRVRH